MEEVNGIGIQQLNGIGVSWMPFCLGIRKLHISKMEYHLVESEKHISQMLAKKDSPDISKNLAESPYAL